MFTTTQQKGGVSPMYPEPLLYAPSRSLTVLTKLD